MTQDNSGPAFPVSGVFDGNRGEVNPVSAYFDAGGMTLRQYIAAHVLAGLVVNAERAGVYATERAKIAVRHADALLAELARRNEP